MQTLNIKGAEIPKLGMGTSGLSGGACTRMVSLALERGFRHIDTAQGYGNEAAVGAAVNTVSIKREDIFVTTKVWMANLSRRDVKRTTEDSLRKLKLDYVDLLLVHWPNDDISMRETLDAFAGLREEGKTRYIGVSNFTLAHMRQAVEQIGSQIICNQIEYHVRLANAQAPMLGYLREQDLALIAYSPLGRGLLPNDRHLRRLGDARNKSASQIALRWLIEQANVAVVTKFSSEAHLNDSLGVFDFALSPAEQEALASLDNGQRVVDPGWGPEWD